MSNVMEENIMTYKTFLNYCSYWNLPTIDPYKLYERLTDELECSMNGSCVDHHVDWLENFLNKWDGNVSKTIN